jgi:glutaredoxin-like YruB-family protein
MKFINIDSYNSLQKHLKSSGILFFYKKGSNSSDCAINSLEKLSNNSIYLIDVNTIKDIHQNYGVHSVPSLVIVNNDKIENIIKGCHTPTYFDQIINKKNVIIKSNETEKAQKRVVVYSTPTCTYCNKLKTYFKKHEIKFTDINVAENQQAAIEMSNKSGQRGVPQTEINGQIIVGFDTQKLSKLLNIPTE